jgi:Xaa-Pro aminopeptidase
MTPTRQQEFDSKLALIRGYLRQQKLGGVLFASQALFAWATAGGDQYVVIASEGGVGSLLVTPDKVTVFANNIEIARLSNEEFKGIDASKIEFWSCPWHTDHQIETEISSRMRGQDWASDTGVAGSRKLGEDFLQLTYTLTPHEIVRYRALGKDCSLAMEEALEDVRPGISEYAIAGLICARLFDRGVRPHLALVASDERAFTVRHPIPKEKKLKKHLMAVLCGKRGGLICSLTRMLHFAKKLPDDLRRKQDSVCAVDLALNTATRVGRPMKDVLAAGIAEYEKQSFAGEWQFHHQGGPTGYQGRSYRGTPTETRKVLANQAFAWNPSIAGTKSEDTILVSDDGFEFLSAPSKIWPSLALTAGGKTYKRPDIKLA